MTHLEEMLQGKRPRAILRPPAVPAPATIGRLAAEYGWLLREVSLERVADKQAFIAAFAAALEFPAWHGHNWDAFEELIRDRSWLPKSNGLILHVTTGDDPAPEITTGVHIIEEAASPTLIPILTTSR